MTKQNTFTEEGYQKLKDELGQLVKKRRPQLIKQLREAREMGSLEDNLQYEVLKSDLEIAESRIAELEEAIKNAQIVEDVSNGKLIDVGSQVKVEIEGEAVVYVIVNPYESNPSGGKISYESPVGQALLGKTSGEEVLVELPHATVKYQILEIIS